MRLIIFLPLSCFLSSFLSMMFRRVILIIWSAVGWGFRFRWKSAKGDDLMVWEMDRDTHNYNSWLFQLLGRLFTPELSPMSENNLLKQETNLKDKRKEKFVNSRQCQQGGRENVQVKSLGFSFDWYCFENKLRCLRKFNRGREFTSLPRLLLCLKRP